MCSTGTQAGTRTYIEKLNSKVFNCLKISSLSLMFPFGSALNYLTKRNHIQIKEAYGINFPTYKTSSDCRLCTNCR